MASIESKYKSELINRINAIQDKSILEEVNRLLEIDTEDTVYETSDDQKLEITKARKQLTNNEGIPDGDANSEIEEWLSK